MSAELTVAPVDLTVAPTVAPTDAPVTPSRNFTSDVTPPAPKKMKVLRPTLEMRLGPNHQLRLVDTTSRLNADGTEDVPALCLINRILNDDWVYMRDDNLPSAAARKALDTARALYPDEELEKDDLFFKSLIWCEDPKQRMLDAKVCNTSLRMFLCYKLSHVRDVSDCDEETLNIFALGLLLLKTEHEAGCLARALKYKGLSDSVHSEMTDVVKEVIYSFMPQKRFDSISKVYQMALFEFAHHD